MLRHLRTKHPIQLVNEADVERQEYDDQQSGTEVEVTLEDGDSDTITTVSGAEIACAINGLFDAEEVAVKQRKQKEASGDGPSTRKRSSIWMYYEHLKHQKVALCLLCMQKMQHNSNTSNLHRHLSTKHPEAFAQLGVIVKKPPSFKSAAPLIHPSTLQCSPIKANASKPSKTIVEEKFPVEVTLEDGDSDAITTVSGAEIACAINGLFDAEEVAVKQRKQKEASGDSPSTRKRSSIWMYYEHLKHQKVALCLLCMKKIRSNSNTSNLHRHLSTKHPEAFARLGGIVKKPPSFKSAAPLIHPSTLQCSPNKADTSKPSKTIVEEKFPVEVTLEDGDSDAITTVSGAEIACAINGLFDAEEVAVKQRKQKEASGDGPSTRKRSSIWMYYEHLKHQKVALCLLCMQKMQHNSNTSNLHRHLSTKHPEAFAQLGGIVKKPPSFKSAAPLIHPSTLQCSPNKADTSKPSKTIVEEKFPDLFNVTRVSEEVRVLERERELTEALRNSQKQEARTLEQQKELLEMLRVANAREAAAERETIELLRRAQEEESKDLRRQREELQKEREDLEVKWEQLQQEREELHLCRGQQTN